jgi:peptidoglycan hydrolase-like amidase
MLSFKQIHNGFYRKIASIILSAFLFCLILGTGADSQAQALANFPKSLETLWQSPVIETASPFTGMIVSYEGSESETSPIEVRTKVSTDEFGEWLAFVPDHDEEHEGKNAGHSEHDQEAEHAQMALMNFTPTTSYQIRVKANNENVVKDLKIELINAPRANTESRFASFLGNLVASTENVFNNLYIIPRSTWGANESLNYIDTKPTDGSGTAESEETNDIDSSIKQGDSDIEKVIYEIDGKKLLWPLQYAKKVRFLVVHHTVSNIDPNKKLSATESAQIVRNIQYFHAVKRRWGDIGYNYLIDPEGRIYEGRRGGERVIGAHSIPVNRSSIGIALIGNYQTDKPTKAALESLANLLAQKADLHKIDAQGFTSFRDKTYPNISGHRDSDATACPGENLYNALPTVRFMASQNLLNQGKVPADSVALDLDPLREIVSLKPQAEATIKVKVKNISQVAWTPSNAYLSYFDSELVQKAVSFPSANPSYKVGILSQSRVNPGETSEFAIKIKSGVSNGFIGLNLLPTIDNKVKRQNPIFVPVYVEGLDFKFKFDDSQPDLSFDLKPGETRNLKLKLKNIGSFIWNNDDATKVKLGVDVPRDQNSQLIANKIEQTGRIWATNNKVAPNEALDLNLTIKAPLKNGVYKEVYRPVIDGLKWADGRALSVTVNVGSSLNSPTTTTAKQSRFAARLSALKAKAQARKQQAATNKPAPSVNTPVTTPTTPNAPTATSALLDEQMIRIHLSYFNIAKTAVSLSEQYNVIVDNKLIGQAGNNSQISVSQWSNTQVGIQFGEKSVTEKTATGKVIRLEPVNKNSGTNIFTLVDYENRPAWNLELNDNQFRGAAEFRIDNEKLIVINELKLGNYLHGLAEVSNGSQPEMIKTLLILARTYAAYYLDPAKEKFKGKPYDLDDSPDRTQKYLGYGFEKRSPNVGNQYPNVANLVVTYNDKVVITPYFSRSDGRTKAAKDVWGWTDTPWLLSVDDSHCPEAKPGKQAGHGVGLSGCGANILAKNGKTYQEIIEYYYSGVKIQAK